MTQERKNVKGSSGAVVRLTEFAAEKTGDFRTIEQGRWLLDHKGCVSLPRVIGTTTDGYRMERLDELDDGETLSITDVFLALQYVWEMPGDLLRFSAEETYDHLVLVVEGIAPQYGKQFMNALKFLELGDDQWALHRHMTHGDPTLENVMRRGSQYVLIDPLPATTYAPNLRAVDLGKILQSSAGWEFDRYGEDHQSWLDLHLDLMSTHYGELETLAALRFALIHLLRALPYIDEAAQQRVLSGSMREVAEKL